QTLRACGMYAVSPATWHFLTVHPFQPELAVDANRALQSLSSPATTAPGAIANLQAHISDTFPNYTVSWTAPGDDVNVGKVTAYEVRFSDTSIDKTNFDLATPLSAPVPNDPNFGQSVAVKIPWRHPSGFIAVRAVDEVGNKGPITSIPISVDAGVGDPYTITETVAAPVSTGGTAMGLIGDDKFKTVNLPFMFKFFGLEYPAVTVSTNGAL